MKKIVYACDKCGAEIQNETYNPMPNEVDLCPRCQVAFSDLLDRFLNGSLDKILTAPEKKPEPKKKKPSKRSSLDLGKIGALLSAGWTIKKIAEEMKCSEQTIRNHQIEALEFYKNRLSTEDAYEESLKEER